jgi:general secretion pathway protein G
MRSRARRARGFTLIELIVTVTLLSILCGMAMPLAKHTAQRQKEALLKANLQILRDAIDRYAEGSLSGKFQKARSYGYPPDLQALVELIDLQDGKKLRLLREIPVDPMTGQRDWGVHSMDDAPESDEWDGGQVWDVYSKSQASGLNGIRYRDW